MLYGNDIDDSTSPIEAGLGWITKFTKDFTNAEALKAEKERGPERKLVGFELDDRGIPRHGYDIVDTNGTVIGNVTSGTMRHRWVKVLAWATCSYFCQCREQNQYSNKKKSGTSYSCKAPILQGLNGI